MKVKINRAGCIGCGLCAGTCPSVFRIGDDGLAEVYTKPDKNNRNDAAEAAANCPVSVITIEE